jgi:hypothetical protein
MESWSGWSGTRNCPRYGSDRAEDEGGVRGVNIGAIEGSNEL